MALFVTKDGRRKSPMALTCFFVVILYCIVFALAYALIAIAGTAVCCLLFFLPDKRIVPYSFAGLPVVTLMLCAAATQLGAAERDMMLYVTLLYTLMPVVVGNLVSWALYLRFWRRRPSQQS